MLHLVTALLLFSETCCNLLFSVCFCKQHSSTHWFALCLLDFIEVTSTEVRSCSYLTIQASANLTAVKGFCCCCYYLRTIALECNRHCFENKFHFTYPVHWNLARSFRQYIPKQWLTTHKLFFSLYHHYQYRIIRKNKIHILPFK